MTNAAIIFNESIRLMELGILKGTGEFVSVEYDDGTTKQIEVPEEIHTFNGWKERCFSVKKGERSQIKFPIWKHTVKKKAEQEKTGNPLEDAEIARMFMKVAAFFTVDQVVPINGKA